MDFENPYISKPEQGLELLASIISPKKRSSFEQRKERNRSYHQLDYMIDHRIMSYTGNLNLPNEIQTSRKLSVLSDRLATQLKYQLLNKRSVVGIGGQFSSGKTAFVNSLIKALNTDLWEDVPESIVLPENLNPSTAVPTYVISGSADEIFCCTVKGEQVTLDVDALEALSHQFSEKYGISVAQFLSFLAVRISNAPEYLKKVALLDTPGYNHAQSGVSGANLDEHKARTQLRTIDYLIWILNGEGGTIKEDDLQFLRSLSLTHPPLIVINKCDLLEDPRDVDAVLSSVRTTLYNEGIEVFGVVTYSAFFPEEFEENRREIEHFLREAGASKERAEDIKKLLESNLLPIRRKFDELTVELRQYGNQLRETISKSRNLEKMQSLILLNSEIQKQLRQLEADKMGFHKTWEKINAALKGYSRGGD